METKLGLYDLLARLVPGGFTLWALNWMSSVSGRSMLPPMGENGFPEAASVVLVAYVLGLVAHSFGSWLVEPLLFRLFGRPSRDHLKNPLILNALLATSIGHGLVEVHTNETARRELFRRALALVSDDAKIQAIQSQYGLHRTMAMVAIALFIVSLVAWKLAELSLWFAVGWLSFSVTFLLSTRKWDYTFTRCALDAAAVRGLSAKGRGANAG